MNYIHSTAQLEELVKNDQAVVGDSRVRPVTLWKRGVLIMPVSTGEQPMMREKTPDDLGLAITILDADRLRQWAEKLDTHGSDISYWADRRFVSEQLRAVAGRIEATVREVGTLRELAGIGQK